MILNIAAAREGFRRKTISDIGFVRSSSNVADGITRQMKQAMRREVINAGVLDVQPEQWIVRKKTKQDEVYSIKGLKSDSARRTRAATMQDYLLMHLRHTSPEPQAAFYPEYAVLGHSLHNKLWVSQQLTLRGTLPHW